MEADSSSTTPNSLDAPPSRFPRRAQGDRYLGGVAGGIANRFVIDPFIVRAAFLGTTLFAAYAADWVPIIPAIYTLLWLLLPGPSNRSLVRSLRAPSGRREAAAAVASFAVVAILLTRPVFGFALALAALAWVLLSDDSPSSGSSAGSISGAEALSSTPVPSHGSASVADTAVPDWSSGTGASDTRWGRSRRLERGEALVSPFSLAANRQRRQPALWPLTLSLLAILAIGAAMADALLDPGLNPAIVINGALIIVGGVLLLSAWKGRALWTALIAVALLPAWIGFSVADVGRFDGYGSTTFTPTSIPESGTLDYENGYGSMTIDLRSIIFEEGDELALNIDATAGTVTVLVDPEIDAVLHSKIGIGTATFQGNGLDYFEYDRVPFLDRFMARRYGAHGRGCIDDYWSSWSLLVDSHAGAGVDFAALSPLDEEDTDAIVSAIENAGFITPRPVVDSNGVDDYTYYEENGNAQPVPAFAPDTRSYRVIDDFGNEFYVNDSPLPIEVEQQIQADRSPFEQAVQDRTWSYSADFDGTPCVPTPAPANPATVEINVTIGIGKLEVHRDQI